MDVKSISSSIINSNTAKTQERQGDVVAKASPNTSTGSADKVTLTDMSSQVKNLEAKAVASNIDNSSRIESIQTAIKEGSYEINAENIANKLIQTERSMTGL